MQTSVLHGKSQVPQKHMLASKNSNIEGDRPSTNKLQKLIAESELQVICARDGAETGKKGSPS